MTSRLGWECPKCHKVYSPDIKECSACNVVQNIKLPSPTYVPIPEFGTGDPLEWMRHQPTCTPTMHNH